MAYVPGGTNPPAGGNIAALENDIGSVRWCKLMKSA